MKERKVDLGPDGKQVDHSSAARSFTTVNLTQDDEWDDWSYQSLDDSDSFIAVNDPEHMDQSDLEVGEEPSVQEYALS